MINDQQSQAPTPQQRYRAVRTLAHHAHDANELAELLKMLGLTPDEGRRRKTSSASR
jgi:hypothetical protein